MNRSTRPREGLILASGSPQRKKLLKELRVPFRIIPSNVSEEVGHSRPKRMVEQLALRKAKAVAATHPDHLVLGADTIVVHRGTILTKPKNRADSKRILEILNGRVHRVYTGVALVHGRQRRSWREVTVSRVRAKRLSESELSRLVGKHMDKAGAYAVQDKNDPFVEIIDGQLDNVIGLPLQSVRRLLRRAVTSPAKRRS